jgi:hypothetical protein
MVLLERNMTRVNLETASHDVRTFVANLPADPNVVELVLDGEVIWRLVRPGEISDREKEALLARGRQLVHDVRQRVSGKPAREIKRKVNEAVDEIRRRPQQ